MLHRLKELLFQNRGTKQTIIKNVFWLSFGQVISRLIRASVIIYAARVLGAGEYGIFSYALGLAGFFTVFADIGIGAILTRETSQKPEEAKKYFATAFCMKSLLLFGTALAIIFLAPYFSRIDGATSLLPLVALLTIFDNLREFSFSYFRGKEKMQIEAFVLIAMNSAIALFGFIALFKSKTSTALTIAYVGSAGVAALITMFILRKEYFGVVKNFARKLIRPILKSAIPIAFLAILGSFMLNIDTIMLGWFRTAEEIGFYSSAQKIVQVLYTLPAILASGIFPALARLVGKGEKEKIRALTEKSIASVSLIAIALTIGGIVLAKSIITFLYGAAYLQAVPVFQILIVTTILIFPGTILGNYIFAHDKQKSLAKYIAGASIGNIALNALLIPFFGIIGAAIATLVVNTGYNAFTWGLSKKIQDFHTFKHLKKIVIAGVCMGIIAFLIDSTGLNVLVTIAISAVAYFGILFLLKEPLLSEALELFKGIKKPELTGE